MKEEKFDDSFGSDAWLKRCAEVKSEDSKLGVHHSEESDEDKEDHKRDTWLKHNFEVPKREDDTDSKFAIIGKTEKEEKVREACHDAGENHENGSNTICNRQECSQVEEHNQTEGIERNAGKQHKTNVNTIRNIITRKKTQGQEVFKSMVPILVKLKIPEDSFGGLSSGNSNKIRCDRLIDTIDDTSAEDKSTEEINSKINYSAVHIPANSSIQNPKANYRKRCQRTSATCSGKTTEIQTDTNNSENSSCGKESTNLPKQQEEKFKTMVPLIAKLKIAGYFEKHDIEDVPRVNDEKIAGKAIQNCIKTDSLRYYSSNDQSNASVSESASPGLCTFKCPDCYLVYTNWIKFGKHLKTTHKKAAAMSEVKRYMVNVTVHVCRICASKILCETSFLVLHLKKHNLNLEQYRQKYNCQKGSATQKGIPKIVENAPVSVRPVSGLCIFKCTDCDSTFTNWESLSSHIKTHSKWKRHKRKIHSSEFGNFIVKAVVHVCKICSDRIICDRVLLKLHFKSKHKMSLEKYKHQYKCDSYWTIKYTRLLQRGSLSANKIGNLCVFSCPVCQKTFKTYSSFGNHTNISCKSANTTARRLQNLKKVISHKCLLCSKLLLCDLRFIKTHLKGHHKTMTIRKYASITGCSIAGVDMEKDKSFEEMAKVAEVTDQIGNFCRYKCDHCNEHFAEKWPSMFAHLKNVHGSSPTKGCHEKHVIKVVMHECKGCGFKLLNDRHILRNHIQSHHQMTLSGYAAKYKLTDTYCEAILKNKRNKAYYNQR